VLTISLVLSRDRSNNTKSLSWIVAGILRSIVHTEGAGEYAFVPPRAFHPPDNFREGLPVLKQGNMEGRGDLPFHFCYPVTCINATHLVRNHPACPLSKVLPYFYAPLWPDPHREHGKHLPE
jgi:hypothetical protein